MQRILVDEKRWFSQRRFLHALNYAMLLPGPEAQQLATYGGWMLHGWRGGLVAGGLFVLPGFLAILFLSVLYATIGDLTLVSGLFFGLKPAVLGIVVQAVLSLGSRALRHATSFLIAATAFIAIFAFGIGFPLIVVGAASLGGVLGVRFSRWLEPLDLTWKDSGSTAPPLIGDESPPPRRPSLWGTACTGALWLAIWWLPLWGLFFALGSEHVLVVEGLFFSKVAMVTFGGAYAVLAYIAQQAVEVFGWLGPGEMLDGLGMAETTPGPLIQVVQFVGFMGAYRSPGVVSPLAAGVLGSVVTTWVTFAPCFLWIFVGAPYIEYLRGARLLTTALSAVTAAVVGVVLNLALWFALHTLFRESRPAPAPLTLDVPIWSSVDFPALAIAVFAFFALFRLRWGILSTLGSSALLGIGMAFFGMTAEG
jgi:chromate transporter